MYSDQELLNWLCKLGDGPEDPPSQIDVVEHPDAPSKGTYHNRFETWEAALLAAGFSELAADQRRDSDRKKAPEYSDDDLLRLLQSGVEAFDGRPTYREWQDIDDVPSVSTYARRFGSWGDALEAAGFEARTSAPAEVEYTDSELLQHIRDLRNRLGRTPSQRDLRRADGPSRWPYMERFGSWSRAKEIALDGP